MQAANNSSSWYRIADLKPCLLEHITVHRQEYREHTWFILHDRHKSRSHRFNSMAYFVISYMDGSRSMQELYDTVRTKYPDDSPSQDELSQLLGRLYLAELVHTDSVPDIDELSQRIEHSQWQKIKQYFMNPLALRFVLLNPDRILDNSLRFIRPLFRKRVLYGWCGLISFALGMTLINWPELNNATRLHTYTTQNMVLLLISYPIIKLLHELGHAYAIKHYGGEVNEMGIMLLIFVPLPYVNAHSALSLADKYQRMLVSAMGIMVESTLAAIALLLWLNIEPGLIRNICLDVMLIGGFSTLLVNGNPLLRYDGYHILADFIESPNLASRSKKYLSYKIHYWLFRIEKSDTGIYSESERSWFFYYALAAFSYRIFIMLFILGMILQKFYALGVLLAGWVISLQIVLPGLRYLKNLAAAGQALPHRRRIINVLGILTLFLLFVLFVIPVPYSSSTQGIIWLAEEMQVKARSAGFIREVLVKNNTHVKQGDALAVMEDPLLAGRIKILQAQLRELQTRYYANHGQQLETAKLKQDIATARTELGLYQQRLADLILKSPADGQLVIPDVQDLPGQFMQHGQLIGFILEPGHIVAQVIIPEQEIALFKQETSQFHIRLLGQPDRIIAARFKRLLPEAIEQLPSAALGIRGGGTVLVDPHDPAGRTTMEKVFQVELALPPGTFAHYIGSRILVRVRHASRPLAWQWGRSLQQLLLGRFNA